MDTPKIYIRREIGTSSRTGKSKPFEIPPRDHLKPFKYMSREKTRFLTWRVPSKTKKSEVIYREGKRDRKKS